VRQRGSHKQFRHADGRVTTVPVHGSRDMESLGCVAGEIRVSQPSLRLAAVITAA